MIYYDLYNCFMDIVDVCVAIAAAVVAAANDAAVIRVFVFASVCGWRTQNCHFFTLTSI